MKVLYIFFLTLITFQFSVAQNCTANVIGISNQADADNFQSLYGQCSTLEANIVLGIGELYHLDSLYSLQFLDGDLILSSETLLSIEGLANLKEVSGYVRIQNLPMLQEIALDSLTNVKGDFFYISDVPRIKSINRLAALDSILGIMHIFDMDSLVSISDFGLNYVGNNFSLFRNPSLSNIDGLQNITNIKGDFRLEDNDLLTSLFSLNDDLIIDGSLAIIDNPNLTLCSSKPICRHVSDPLRSSFISGNGDMCSNQETVIMNCSLSTFDTNTANIVVFPNPANHHIYVDGYHYPNIVKIYNSHGSVAMQCQCQSLDVSNLVEGFYFGISGNDRFTFIKR